MRIYFPGRPPATKDEILVNPNMIQDFTSYLNIEYSISTWGNERSKYPIYVSAIKTKCNMTILNTLK